MALCPVRLSEPGAAFVDAIRREFGFLVDLGFLEQPVGWDGRAVRLIHAHPKLEIVNSLEAEKLYLTLLTPLTEGRRPRPFDDDFNEPFVSFEIEDLPDLDDFKRTQYRRHRYDDIRELEAAVVDRAAEARQFLPQFLSNGKVLDGIRSTRRTYLLAELIPRWRDFVDRVQAGYDGSISEFITGVNVRGQIESLLKWPGALDTKIGQDVRRADSEFDQLTVPIAHGQQGGLYPHPRAKRWWRLPEKLRGRLKEYFLRGAAND